MWVIYSIVYTINIIQPVKCCVIEYNKSNNTNILMNFNAEIKLIN